MRTYLLQRALAGFVTLIGVTILIFIAMRVLPGDPLAMMTSESGMTHTLSDEDLQAARAALGLDRPYYQQYLAWMADVARGNLGKSFWREEPINELIKRRGPITFQIAVLAVVLSWLIGIPVGDPERGPPQHRHRLRLTGAGHLLRGGPAVLDGAADRAVRAYSCSTGGRHSRSSSSGRIRPRIFRWSSGQAWSWARESRRSRRG